MPSSLSPSAQMRGDKNRFPEASIVTDANRIPTWALIGMHIGLLILLAASFFSRAHISAINGDLRGYEEIAKDMIAIKDGPWISYFSFYFYPPLANITFLIGRFNTFSVLPYDAGLLITNLLFGAAGAFFVVDQLQRKDLRWLFASILLTVILLEPSTFFARYDFFPAFSLLLSALSLRRKKYGAAGILLGASFMLKFAPIFLLPLCLVLTERGKRLRFFAGFAAACLLTCLAYDAMVGWGASYDVFRGFMQYRTHQLVYVFSAMGSIDFFVNKLLGSKAIVVWLDPNLGNFVDDFPAFVPAALQILTITGSLIIAGIAALDTKRNRSILLYVASGLFWILFSTSFCSNHYYLWVLPFVFYWFCEQREASAGIPRLEMSILLSSVIIALIGHYSFPYGYYDLTVYQTWMAVTLNLVKNMLVFSLSILCLYAAKRTSSPD